MITFHYKPDLSTLKVGGLVSGVKLMPEDDYLRRRAKGEYPDSLPMPSWSDGWRFGELEGEQILVTKSDYDLSIVAVAKSYGFAYIRYHADTAGGEFKGVSYHPITSLLKEINVMGQDLNQLLAQYSANANAANGGGGMVNQMNLDRGSQPMQQQQQMPVYTRDSITDSVDPIQITSNALLRSYVFGYIVNVAPCVQMALTVRRSGNNEEKVLVPKESKPGKPREVLIAVPKNCVMRNGILADPTDISAGRVDFNTIPKDEMLYLSLPYELAMCYIDALGGRMAEYAPNVTNATAQWTPEQIQSESDGVSYVIRKSTRYTNNGTEDVRFNLKSTSERRSLYSRKNICCLRAYKTFKVDESSAEGAYNTNVQAFGSWRYSGRGRNNASQSKLERAVVACPATIWTGKATVNGEEVEDAIFSAYFMHGNEVTRADGTRIAKVTPMYTPWDCPPTRDKNGGNASSLVPVTHIKLYEKNASTASNPNGMHPVRMNWGENQGAPEFKPYAAFTNKVIAGGYVSADRLKSMTSRASTTSVRSSVTLNDKERNSFKTFQKSTAVSNQLSDVRGMFADRDALARMSAK